MDHLRAGDLAHGIVERQAEELDMEVDGVASQIALWPAPVTVFDDDTIPHPTSPSEINRSQFAGERARYWRQRARELLGQQ